MEKKIYSREDVENLTVGDEVLNCFGKLHKVTSITYRGIDINGKAYVGFYQEFSEHCQISNSMKEGESIALVS